MRAETLLPVCVAAVVLGGGCEEDALSEIHPRILVCPSEDAPDDDCDRAIDLGERFVTVEHELSLFVRNRGEAPLEVGTIASSADVLDVEPRKVSVNVGGMKPVTLTLLPVELGAQQVLVTFESDDPDRPTLELPLRFVGTPKPVPVLELCVVNEGPERCGDELDEDLGVVRRTQQESRTLAVRNVGDATLEISAVHVEDASSQPGELSVVTSTRPGTLAPGDEAVLLLVYAPVDGEPDELTLAFETNDPTAEGARVRFLADSDENLPPVALASGLDSGLVTFEATVGDVVVVDGAASSDPEGDPLVYQWALTTPVGSAASLDDPAAGRVSFVPDVAGTYRAELVVTDSLAQQSVVPAVVLVEALPGAVLRVRLSWEQGGDVDLHVVPAADALFGETDAFFENPRPDLGVAEDPSDDPTLLVDDEGAPGVEELVFVAPPDGSYRIYAHYYDEAGAGPALVRVSLTMNDANAPVLDDTRTLQAGCALWTVAEVTLPSGVVSNSAGGLSSLCP